MTGVMAAMSRESGNMRVRARALLGAVTVLTVALAGTLPAVATPSAVAGQTWTRQFGTVETDYVADVDTTSSGTYATGLWGEDASLFLRRYNANGTVAWARDLGGSEYNQPGGVDAYGSAVYVAATQGVIDDDANGMLRKYAADGALLWERIIGTEGWFEGARPVKATADGVYVAGWTRGVLAGSSRGGRDIWLRKYSHSGALQWTRQFGSADDDRVNALVGLADGVVVAGDTPAGLPGYNAAGGVESYVRKYGSRGAQGWTRQFGSSGHDWLNGATLAGGSLYVAGSTTGTLGAGNQGGEDAYVRRLSTQGSVEWTRQFGTSQREFALDVEAAGSNLYVAGATGGTLRGAVSSGALDAFARRLTLSGGLVWDHQSGSEADDAAHAVDGGLTGVYLGGGTDGYFATEGHGGADAFVQRVLSHRPDGLLSTGDGTGYAGGDVYNDDGSGQAKAVTRVRGESQTFYLRVENDGDTSDGIAVHGCGGTAEFGVRYFAGLSGGTEITSQVAHGTYVFSSVAPNAERALRVVIRVRSAAEHDDVRRCAIEFTSNNRPVYADQVVAIVRAR